MTISVSDTVALEESQDKEVVLSVQGVSKKFCRDLKRSLLYGVQDIASELIGVRGDIDKLRKQEFWALKDVSFELRRGEALGLVGKNGSGKTTLLRIISGLIRPDAGSVTVKGRVAPLIALGAGFNPILTGRENIYANMSILGLSKQEIDERFDEVVEFAEIGEAIDAPVQSYSSGMAARLGFATAIHTEPDILLIDEVLAVGDVRFRAKCYRMLAKLREKGVSFILVSHNANSILAVCESAIYLLKGKVVTTGTTDLVMRKYEEDLFSNELEGVLGFLKLPAKSEDESSGIDFTYLCFKDSQGNILESPTCGEPIHFCMGCRVHKKFENIGFNIMVSGQSSGSEKVLRLNTSDDNESFSLHPGKYEIVLQLPYCGIRPGLYTMKLSVRKGILYQLDAIESFKFKIENSGNMSECLFYQPRKWKIVESSMIQMKIEDKI